jgi:hypothetical protein
MIGVELGLGLGLDRFRVRTCIGTLITIIP